MMGELSMRYITREQTLILYKDDIVNFTDYINAYNAFSIYKNTCVVWDDDFDHRVLDLIDHMPDFDQEELVVIYEHEGGLSLLWLNNVPSGYEEGVYLDVPKDMDTWIILKSITVLRLPHLKLKK
jgi:hypothetical protein|tara:strand:- start:103 stop:477 length:375 start_codon:yes stop_codon:yes gene_type:complete